MRSVGKYHAATPQITHFPSFKSVSLFCRVFVLFGPAGLLAYWLGHHRPPLEKCLGCGRQIPRDRDGCPACGTPFAPPALVGTEVFTWETPS